MVSLILAKSPKLQKALFRTVKEPEPYVIPEWKLQAVVVSDWHKRQDRGERFEFAGDMNGVALSPSQAGKAKLTGMTAGEADLRVYLPVNRFKMIELKNEKGVLTKAQKIRHPKLRALGFEIVVVKVSTEEDAIYECGKILDRWIAESFN